MGKQRNDPLIGRLALAIAAGSTATKWAREQGLEPRTVRNWARLPQCKLAVERHRRQIVDRAIGKLTRHTLAAVDEIAKLMKTGENGSVKLSAAKAILTSLMDVENHAAMMKTVNDLAARLDKLEKADATDRKNKPVA
jgi:predicted transcriptional regulator